MESSNLSNLTSNRSKGSGVMNSNFSFLATTFPALEKLGSLAESYLYSDPNSCLYKLGVLAETVVNYMFELDGLTPPAVDNTAANRIKC